jgi:RNase P/RNase MRP subunit POP5
VTVREKTGRNRYVAFVVTPPAPKTRLLAALKASPGERPWLVLYDGTRGLMRCAHTSKEATLVFLNALRVDDSVVRTTGTSGTIRKARQKFLSNTRE